jgi:ubiquinone/menaquinone biosynthesis C-methylase UbiE
MQQLDAVVKLGINTSLPFESKKFDVLLSLSTIHYEETLENVDLALREFRRVLNEDGVALIQTVAPNHDIYKNSKNIGESLYQLNMNEDIRHLQKFIFFKEYEDFSKMAKKYFGSIEVARCTEDYPNSCIDFWLFKLGKPLN